jgi:hypothetical protein
MKPVICSTRLNFQQRDFAVFGRFVRLMDEILRPFVELLRIRSEARCILRHNNQTVQNGPHQSLR